MERTGDAGGGSVWPWTLFVVAASLVLSRAFACAMPFAALAALGAFTLPRRYAALLMLASWLGNQAIGFGLMHYPWEGSTLAWGSAIGIATLAALTAAGAVAVRAAPSSVPAWALGLFAAYAAYELVLWLAAFVLPSGPSAFAVPVVLKILFINAVALGLLLAARAAANHAGLATQRIAVLRR